MTKCFLETSFLINYLTNIIEDDLDEYDNRSEWVVSSFVRGEIKQAFFKKANYLYNLYLDEEDIERRLSRLTNPNNSRLLNISLKVKGLVEEMLESENRTYSEKDRRNYVTELLRQLIMNFKTTLDNMQNSDETGCVVGTLFYTYDEKRNRFNTSIPNDTCSNEDNTCCISEFLMSRSEESKIILDILDNCSNIRENDEKSIKQFEEAISDSEQTKSGDICKKCGDIIISLEQPDDSILLNHDKFFEILCNALNKKQVYFE